MKSSSNGLEFDLGSVLLSEDDDQGGRYIQTDGYGGASSPSIELHAPYGLHSKPLDPVIGKNGVAATACKALIAYEGDRGHAWLAEDPRIIALLPTLKPGESIFYGPTSNFLRAHADGRMSLYTTDDGTPNGHAIMRSVDPDPTIGGCVDQTPWGSTMLNQTGWHVTTVAGATIDLGGIGGIPAPVGDAVGTYCDITADSVTLNASAICLGAGTSPVALATPLLSLFAALDTLLAELSVVLLVPAANGKPVDAGGFVAALEAFEAAKAPLLLQMQSASTAAS